MNIKDYKIKVADITELEHFLLLERICFSGDFIFKPEYKRLFERKNVRIIGVWYLDKLIASAVIIFKRLKKRARLYSFCLEPEFRGKGIANAMLSGIEDECFSSGYSHLMLEVDCKNNEAFNLYTCRQYEVIGFYKKYYENGNDAIRMQKKLTPIPFEKPKTLKKKWSI
jgi:[ribosomal protein S18]-alanine N-acetyltransferase